MQVYVEYAIAENFCMDYFLLFSAKAACKNPCGWKRLFVASALGACFAVVYPLFGVSGFWGIVIKLASGAAICVIAGRFAGVKDYLKFTAAFLFFSFALGGALLGVYSLAGIAYEDGGGFLISSVPVGIPLFAALCLALAVKVIARKFSKKHEKTAVSLRIYANQSQVEAKGFYDSGNKVYSLGSPVSVVPLAVAEKLVKVEGIKTFTKIHTVAGSKKIAVFVADKMEIEADGKIKTVKRAVLGISPSPICEVVLHPDLP